MVDGSTEPVLSGGSAHRQIRYGPRFANALGPTYYEYLTSHNMLITYQQMSLWDLILDALGWLHEGDLWRIRKVSAGLFVGGLALILPPRNRDELCDRVYFFVLHGITLSCVR